MTPASTSAPAPPQALTPPLRAIVRSLAWNAAVPFVLFSLAKQRYGASDVVALSLAALFPLVGSVVEFARRRRLDPIGALALAGIVVSMIALALGGSPQLLLIRESFVTGLFGLACFVSLLLPKPLMYYFARHFTAGDDPTALVAFDARWQRPAVRRAMRTITVGWGIAYVGEFVLRVVLVLTLPVAVVLVVAPLILDGLTLAAIAGTFAYVRWLQRQAGAARPATSPEVVGSAVATRTRRETCCDWLSCSRPVRDVENVTSTRHVRHHDRSVPLAVWQRSTAQVARCRELPRRSCGADDDVAAPALPGLYPLPRVWLNHPGTVAPALGCDAGWCAPSEEERTPMDRENPWAEVGTLQEWFERQQRHARQGRWPAIGRWTPQLDVLEDDQTYRIRLAVPGVRPDDVQITVEQNVVTVSGELRPLEPEGGARYLHQEQGGGHFTRSIALPGMVDPDQTRATFEYGIVTIVLPKHAATRPRRIAVQTIGGQETLRPPAPEGGPKPAGP